MSQSEGEEQNTLPGGVVTFVFTDIEGSTALFRALGERYPSLLDAHNEILRSIWQANGGVEVKTEGDAFFVAFADAASAIRASVEAVESLAAHPWPEDGVIRARIGMHTGVGYPRNGDYIAFPVHQAARIGGVGHGGQVVVSPETAEAAGPLPEITLHDLGFYRVRDFDNSIRLFQAEPALDGSAGPRQFPALRTKADVQHNIPADLPMAYGRAFDGSGITQLLDDARVVSVVGPGGVGKTLLARTLARQLAEQYADGAWFVDLSSHRDLPTIRGAIADVLEVGSGELDDHLKTIEALLVLDNTEQVTADAGRLVAELTSAGPNLSILVTSREPLAIGLERVWRLNPLTDEASSTELFAERARAVDPSFDIDTQRPMVAELCRRLDGLPLAIELAAARVTALSVAEISESLEDRLRVLRSRRRDLDDRQRTAVGLVDWSYQLLDEDEKLVFRKLSVFRGGFDLDGATAAAADSGLDRVDVADIVWSLSEKSLLLPVIGDGTTRYRSLETVRAFARQALIDAGQLETTNRQVGMWYRTRFDPTQAFTRRTAAAVSEEIATMRAVARDLAATDDPSLGQWLVWSMALSFRTTEPGRTLAELRPLITDLSVPGEAAVGMLAIAAHTATIARDLDLATEFLAKAKALSEAETDPVLAAGWLVNTEALGLVIAGDPAGGIAMAAGAAAWASTLEQVSLINTIGVANAEQEELDAADEAFEQMLALAEETGAIDAEVVALGAIAEIAHRNGDLERAAAHTLTGLRLAVENGLRAQTAMTVVGAARLLADAERLDEAVELHTAADRILAETGQRLFESDRVLSDQMYQRAEAALGSDRVADLRAVGDERSDLEVFVRAGDALESLADRNLV